MPSGKDRRARHDEWNLEVHIYPDAPREDQGHAANEKQKDVEMFVITDP
jgi:hypothetical protein